MFPVQANRHGLATGWTESGTRSLIHVHTHSLMLAAIPPHTTTTKRADGEGYNISLPGQLCADTVIGVFISPTGKIYRNASLAMVYTSLVRLSPQTLLLCSRKTLELAILRLYITLEHCIYKPPSAGSRVLLFRSSVSERNGEYCSAILAGLAVPIFAGTMYIPLAHCGVTAKWPGVALWNIATYGFALLTTYGVIVARLRTTLHLFLMEGLYIREGLGASWDDICATSAKLWEQVKGLCAESWSPGLQALGLILDHRRVEIWDICNGLLFKLLVLHLSLHNDYDESE